MTGSIVGRSGAVAAVRQQLDGVRDSRGGALFIVGEAGLGKSTLLEYAIALAQTHFLVGLGRGDVVEAVLPFGLVGQALGQLGGGELLEPSLGGSADASAGARLYAILRAVREAAIRPLLLAFDDLHWSDPDSLTAIHLLCRRLADLPVALIATTRPWPSGAVESAQHLAAQGFATLERLAPLSPCAAAAVLRARVGKQVPSDVVERVVALCAGNPLLLEQVAGGLRRGENLFAMGGVIGAEPSGRFLLQRFLGLGKSGQRYVRAASVLGTRFRPAVATEVGGLPGHEASDVLEALFRGGLVKESGAGWAEFTHALVWQAVYEDLAGPVRARLHEAAFRALAARGVHPAEAAQHAIPANLVGDPEAVAVLAWAGKEALRAGAVEAARRHLEAGAELAGEAAPTELLLDLGKALIAGGATEAAIAVYERLLRRSSLPHAMRIATLGQLGQAAFHGGLIERAAAWFEAAVHLAEQGHPELAVRALIDHSFQTWARLGPRAALPLAQRARELAGEDPTPMRACADAAWGLCAYLTGDPRGLDVTQAAARSVGSTLGSLGESHWVFDPVCVPADVAHWAEHFTDAQRLYASILAAAEARCEPMILCHASFCLADCLCRLGRLEEALARCEHALEIAELLPVMVPFPTAYKALILLEMGRLDEAAGWCEKLAVMARGHSWHLVVMFDHHRRGTLALRRGQVQAACTLFAPLLNLVNTWGVLDPCQIPWAGDAFSAFLAGGRDADARRILEWIQPRAAVLPSRWPKLVLATGQALLAEREGNRAAAQTGFARALALHDEMDVAMPLARAATLTEYGAFLNRHGEPARARPILAEALRITDACGAEWHASRARIEWRRAGGRVGTAADGELTPQEAAVSRLVKAGNTNQQIAQQLHLSVKTVETHLAHIYQKLGIHRRWELIARPDLER